MKLQFFGAAQEVTGSCHLITLDDGFTILLDCGLYQGGDDAMEKFNETWYFDPHKIDTLVLSHAHIDHTGRVPKLVKDGFSGAIHATHATRGLCAIMLMDAAKIQESDAKYAEKLKNKAKKPARKKRQTDPSAEEDQGGGGSSSGLYNMSDVHATMQLFNGYNYERWFKIHDNVEVMFRDAGHILGSASVSLRITEGNKVIRIAFSGDIGRPNRPILRDPMPMPEAEYIIAESTYGDRDHSSAPNEENRFLEILRHTCIEKKGKLIIPAFSVGRTQEIVYMMNMLWNAKKLPPVPVYVDSPLSVNATEIFKEHPECFDEQLYEYLTSDKDPFGFNTLRYVRDSTQSKRLNTLKQPCVIISSSGMMNAGRIRHHLFNNIENPRNTILIVGYCSPYTTGGQLRAGATELQLFGQTKIVRAQIEMMDSFSAHGDRHEMRDFLANQKASMKKLFLVHGTLDRQEKYKTFLQEDGFGDIEIPKLKDSFNL